MCLVRPPMINNTTEVDVKFYKHITLTRVFLKTFPRFLVNPKPIIGDCHLHRIFLTLIQKTILLIYFLI